jgi:glycosyltransferase involved in cell wall biosynthesis
MAMLEAQAAGLPVVAGRGPGVAMVVREGESGLLTPPGDATAFAEAVASLLEDAALRRSMGEAAAGRVRRDQSLEAASARLDAFLRELAAP